MQHALCHLDESAAIFASGIQRLTVSHSLPGAIRGRPPLANQLYCLDPACNQLISPRVQPQQHELRPDPLRRAESFPCEVHIRGDQLALQDLQTYFGPELASHWLESLQPLNHSVILLLSVDRPHLKQEQAHHRKGYLLPALACHGEHQQHLQG